MEKPLVDDVPVTDREGVTLLRSLPYSNGADGSVVIGARYVVDASKWPVQALALSLSGTDVRVVQVVRDPRGVAHSQSKSDVARPQAGLGATMDSRPALSAAVRAW